MMLIMGQSNRIWHYWAGKYPGSVGVLVAPSYGSKVPLDPWMPFVLDNDAYGCFCKRVPWLEGDWLSFLHRIKMRRLDPLWAIVPDVVGDRVGTINNWSRYSHTVRGYGWKTAFAVQDGMTPDDVPGDADVVFVGGTDGWKFPNLPMWCESFDRVHCGRVNSVRMIERCEELGCESVDGTGWFRDPSRNDKLPAIKRFIEGNKTTSHYQILAGLDQDFNDPLKLSKQSADVKKSG